MKTTLHTDYLGNLILRDGNHYYPYGGLIGVLCTGQEEQEFKFGDRSSQQIGKIEYLPREDEGLSESPDRTYGLDLYDFEARQYDAIAPWFTSIDPLAEKYYSISPYAYCAGDPVNLVDPTGRDIFGLASDGRIYWVAESENSVLLAQDPENEDEVIGISLSNDDMLNDLKTKENEYMKDGETIHPDAKYNVHSTATTNSKDAEKLFRFCLQNSNVEWAFKKGKDGQIILGTSQSNEGVAVQNPKDKVLDIHAHVKSIEEGTCYGASPKDIDNATGSANYYVVSKGYNSIFKYRSNGKNVNSVLELNEANLKSIF